MTLKQIAMLLLCFKSSFAERGQDILSKFYQDDYKVKDYRIGSVDFNKEFIQDMSFVYSRYNRSTKIGNLTILSRVNLGKHPNDSFVEVYKRYGNEFKTFGLSYSFSVCEIIDTNIIGLGVQTCGQFSCPIKKNVRQTLCNWIPDYSRLPPLIPEGQYMVKHTTMYQNQFLFNCTIFGTVYHEVKIPKLLS